MLTSCTFYMGDAESDYDIDAVVWTPECKVTIKRIESRTEKPKKLTPVEEPSEAPLKAPQTPSESEYGG